MTSAMNDINNHKVCGDAAVLVGADFKAEFAKRRNNLPPQLACSVNIFKETLGAMARAMPEANWQYAMKTNDADGLLATVILEGHGFDCSSVGEASLVYDVATFLGEQTTPVMLRCSYGNPNKTSHDIKEAYELGIRMFSVDDKTEMDKIAIMAPGSKVYLRMFIGDTQGSAISKFTNKFGVNEDAVVDLARYAKKKGLVPYSVGLSVGGGQTDPTAFQVAIERVAGINKRCQDAGVASMTGITFCGGLPAQSAAGAPSFNTIGKHVRDACKTFGIAANEVTFEPGRSLGTTCGIIEAKVITMKAPPPGQETWSVVLNIGPFKGLFEMVRTNLTYKIAAYEKGEMVDCRLVDDTCDSQGVCFKETIIKMPKSLVEGSRVYFLHTGSYTTAYNMELFNRTHALISFCFPDLLPHGPDPRPWMKDVVTQGVAAHPGKDFKALRVACMALATDDERRSLLTKAVPGAGSLGVALCPASDRQRFRELNSAILKHDPSLPGDVHQIGFQPQSLYKTIPEGWVANSSFLSLDHWKNFGNIKAKGGASVYFCLQNQYRSTARLCTLMHATLVIVPDDKADGPPSFLEVNYNPYALEGLDTKVIDRAFGKDLRNEKVYRDPSGPFEQLMVGAKLEPTLATADLAWGGPIDEREPLSVYWPDATAKDGKKRPINLEGALEFALNERQHAVLMQMMGFLNASYAAGYGVSNRAHVDANSCLRTTIRALVAACLGRDQHFGEEWSTDRVIEHLAKMAKDCLWTDTPGHSIRDMKRFKRESKTVDPATFVANTQAILCHKTMRTAFGGENAYNTDYMTITSLPHTDYNAQELYRLATKLDLAALETKAQQMGAI